MKYKDIYSKIGLWILSTVFNVISYITGKEQYLLVSILIYAYVIVSCFFEFTENDGGIILAYKDINLEEEYKCPKCGSQTAHFYRFDNGDFIVCSVCRFSEKMINYVKRE